MQKNFLIFKEKYVSIEDITIERIGNTHRYSNNIYRRNKKLTKLGVTL